MIPVLVPIDTLKGDPANPRDTDPARLALVELSLRKLGFLLPVVAAPDGKVYSGHQRLKAARSIGLDAVPVLAVAPGRYDAALNVLLNRATNDAARTDFDYAREPADTIRRLGEALPDCANLFRCLTPRQIPVRSVLAANPAPFDSYMTNVAKSLRRSGVHYPLVLDPDLRLVNGAGRLYCHAAANDETVPAVVIGAAEADFARAALNRLSMDYAFAGSSADDLRANAFRRERLVRRSLGSGLTFAVWPGKLKAFSLADPEHRRRWIEMHGVDVCNFGSGLGDEDRMLRRIGVRVTSFEPSCHWRRSASLGCASPASLKMLVGAFWAVKMASAFNPTRSSENTARILAARGSVVDTNPGASRPFAPR